MKLLARIIATVFGAGYSPIAPGTAGSLVAVGIWWLWFPEPSIQWSAAAAATVVGLWASHELSRQESDKDPSKVVIDEVAGMWIALAGLPHTFAAAIAAFLIFRALDITKIPPMKQLEHLPGGLGIMADDVAAGVITRVIVGIGLVLIGGG